VWHEGEHAWWLLYLQNRYNSPASDPRGTCPYCSLTDIGLASTPDHGETWVYRGVARGLDIPPALRHDRRNPMQQFGGATWYRPAVLRVGAVYHGFWVYSEVDRAGGYKIVHYSSTNLKDWEYVGVVAGDRGYDSVCFRADVGAAKRYVIMSTQSNQAFESPDLAAWRPVNASDKQLNREVGEGPHVVEWRGARWLNWEACAEPMRIGGCLEGPGLLRSTDGGSSWVKLSPDLPNVGDAWIKSDSGSAPAALAAATTSPAPTHKDCGETRAEPARLISPP